MNFTILLVSLIIFILIFNGVKKGSITFTFKKIALGLVLTLVIINVVMFLIM
ncbi:hypothetical protein [Metabacillus litoralis]|uniref:hypothetical protein n=1 Tax=Metabacillus litoralis TaxID=152268 RepID=UPI001CFE1F06|nr:hypothetical protein [Metabacillus litoralis]